MDHPIPFHCFFFFILLFQVIAPLGSIIYWWDQADVADESNHFLISEVKRFHTRGGGMEKFFVTLGLLGEKAKVYQHYYN